MVVLQIRQFARELWTLKIAVLLLTLVADAGVQRFGGRVSNLDIVPDICLHNDSHSGGCAAYAEETGETRRGSDDAWSARIDTWHSAQPSSLER